MKKINNWLLPMMTILFVLQIIAFPFAMELTYAGRSETTNQVLTYTVGQLMWNDALNIDSQGVAELSLFDVLDENVKSDDVVVAPGMENMSIVRLKNDADKAISYTAILYEIKSNELLPVEVEMHGNDWVSASSYTLPSGVNDSNVLQAVSGEVLGGHIQDFDISWIWQFEIDEKQDVIDTMLGNKDQLDDIKVGLYIVVNDENDYFRPQVPQTGDDNQMTLYFSLLGVSGCILIVLLIRKRMEDKDEEIY